MRLLSPHIAGDKVLRELDAQCAVLQPPRNGNANWIAVIKLAEWEELRDHLGAYGCAAVLHCVSDLIKTAVPQCDRIVQTHSGDITLVVRDRSEAQLERLLALLSARVVGHVFVAGGEPVRVTPAIGFVAFGNEITSRTGLRCARTALDHSLARLDLRPTPFSNLLQQPSRWHEWMLRLRVQRWVRFAFHILLALLLSLALPLAIYLALPEAAAMVVTTAMFIVALLVLVTTATLINIEGVLSLRPERRPDEPRLPYPKASAIVVAYLPSEAASVVATIESMLAIDYPAPLQIILSYNTPHDLPVESLLEKIAKRDKRFVPLRVPHSTSKAQNINAALSIVDGEFTAIFDADHRPEPDSFKKAWHWLSGGADVVQGHCVIRNGSASWLSRIVAVEFEQIYAVAHPGSARLHGYGIFGGSNGYWRTSLLREIRMRGSMLTEDIDATMRAVREGRRIVSDPEIISTELAPVTLRGLTHQRLRWNQGWFQVSLRHLWPLLKSPKLRLRQKIGTFHLLAWREMFPWFSLQVLPILAFWIIKAGSVEALDWTIPLLLGATFYVLSVGPLQTLIAHANAAPLIRKQKGWFLLHLVTANLYSEYLTLLTRVAHLRQLLGEREWCVTLRSAEVTAPVTETVDPVPGRRSPTAEERQRAPIVFERLNGTSQSAVSTTTAFKDRISEPQCR